MEMVPRTSTAFPSTATASRPAPAGQAAPPQRSTVLVRRIAMAERAAKAPPTTTRKVMAVMEGMRGVRRLKRYMGLRGTMSDWAQASDGIERVFIVQAVKKAESERGVDDHSEDFVL